MAKRSRFIIVSREIPINSFYAVEQAENDINSFLEKGFQIMGLNQCYDVDDKKIVIIASMLLDNTQSVKVNEANEVIDYDSEPDC